ncbi:MAG: hypothetical protein WD824_21430, partial [Cyclobacteriaceae bacterium]
MKKVFTGLTVPQQYICLSLEDFENPLSVFLTAFNKDRIHDVTTTQLFLGYMPLMIGIVFSDNSDTLEEEEHVCLNFIQGESQTRSSWRGFLSFKNCLARLILRRISCRELKGQRIVLYEGEYGEHHFLNPFHQFINT